MVFTLEKKQLACECRHWSIIDYPPHIHTHTEFVYIKKGHAMATAGEHVVHLNEGDLFVSFPNQIHSYFDSFNCEYIALFISPDFCQEFTDKLSRHLPITPVLHSVHNNITIMNCLQNMLELTESENVFKQELLKAYSLIFFSELFTNINIVKQPHTQDANLMVDIIHYCYQNYSQDISLNTLAHDLGVTHFYISRIFNKEFHTTFRDYINFLRIQKASELIATSNMSFTEIALTVGYNNLRTFDRCFLKSKKISPSEYKANLHADL